MASLIFDTKPEKVNPAAAANNRNSSIVRAIMLFNSGRYTGHNVFKAAILLALLLNICTQWSKPRCYLLTTFEGLVIITMCTMYRTFSIKICCVKGTIDIQPVHWITSM